MTVDSTSLLRLEKTSLRQQALTALRRAITTGQLTPGTHLVETELSDALQISRGTLHNALINFNSQTGCHNAQGRVGWAMEQRILIVENREIQIAPEYRLG